MCAITRSKKALMKAKKLRGFIIRMHPHKKKEECLTLGGENKEGGERHIILRLEDNQREGNPPGDHATLG